MFGVLNIKWVRNNITFMKEAYPTFAAPKESPCFLQSAKYQLFNELPTTSFFSLFFLLSFLKTIF